MRQPLWPSIDVILPQCFLFCFVSLLVSPLEDLMEFVVCVRKQKTKKLATSEFVLIRIVPSK